MNILWTMLKDLWTIYDKKTHRKGNPLMVQFISVLVCSLPWKPDFTRDIIGKKFVGKNWRNSWCANYLPTNLLPIRYFNLYLINMKSLDKITIDKLFGMENIFTRWYDNVWKRFITVPRMKDVHYWHLSS